ncbi:MAG: hypothetical protein AB1540_04630, partial [Bdellovibrionota bacterium]
FHSDEKVDVKDHEYLYRYLLTIFLVSVCALVKPIEALASSGISSSQNAATELCSFEGIAQRFAEMVDRSRNYPRQLELIAASKAFKVFARKHGLGLDDAQEELKKGEALLQRYLEWNFARVASPETLKKLQEGELRASLMRHGVEVPLGEARQTLKKISAANLKRELLAFPYKSVPEMREAERIIKSIRPFFTHNTNVDPMALELPVVSSRQLRILNGEGGINSQTTFTNGFLKSDNHVFFSVFLKFKDQIDGGRITGYGKNWFSPTDAYAQEWGWISADMMYESDLVAFAKNRTPELWAKIEAELGETSFAKFDAFENHFSGDPRIPQIEEYLERVKKNLWQLDFTVKDFAKLIQNHLLFKLNRLRLEDPGRFEHMMQILNSKFLWPSLPESCVEA